MALARARRLHRERNGQDRDGAPVAAARGPVPDRPRRHRALGPRRVRDGGLGRHGQVPVGRGDPERCPGLVTAPRARLRAPCAAWTGDAKWIAREKAATPFGDGPVLLPRCHRTIPNHGSPRRMASVRSVEIFVRSSRLTSFVGVCRNARAHVRDGCVGGQEQAPVRVLQVVEPELRERCGLERTLEDLPDPRLRPGGWPSSFGKSHSDSPRPSRKLSLFTEVSLERCHQLGA